MPNLLTIPQVAERRILCHFSCGAASAVATQMTLKKYAGREIAICYAETGAEDADNERFLKDCERWFGVPVIRLKSTEYADTWDVWEKRQYISGIAGAPCTRALKIIPQKVFERPEDTHIFGYTADKADVTRAELFRENWPDMKIETPLIEAGISKAACLAILQGAGIAPPRTYAMGFSNANCIPCCKATSPGYWALVRRHFPEEFARMAELSRRLGARLARLKGERIFIDEIPADQPITDPIAPACDFLCGLVEQELHGDG